MLASQHVDAGWGSAVRRLANCIVLSVLMMWISCCLIAWLQGDLYITHFLQKVPRAAYDLTQ